MIPNQEWSSGLIEDTWYCILVQCNNDLHHPLPRGQDTLVGIRRLWRHQRWPQYFTDNKTDGARGQGEHDLTHKKKPKTIKKLKVLTNSSIIVLVYVKPINSRVSKRDAESTLNRLQQSLSILHCSAVNAFLLQLNLLQLNLEFAFQI